MREWIMYNGETREFRVFYEDYFLRLRGLSENPSDDPEFTEEFDLLHEDGWDVAEPLDVAIAMGDVHDMESLERWLNKESPG